MKLLHRYSVGCVVGIALLMTACEVGVMDPMASPDLGDDINKGVGVKPTVPLKRRPIVPTTKLPRPRVIERIGWTEAGALSVALAEDATGVVTIVERDGTLRSHVVDGRVVEVVDVPEEAFEVQIDVADKHYTAVVE